jgi:REP element-mobilizing transposase RayT
MSSPPPVAYNTYYHIYNRGNNRENLFKEERNYRYFLKLYAKHIEPIADTFAYCLLPNHFHLLVRIKAAEEIEETLKEETLKEETLKVFKTFRVLKPSQQFSNLFNAYTKAINNAYPRTGSLFEHPFGRKPVDSDAYFTQLVIYIHQNPQRHGLIADFRDWPYSSYHAHLSAQQTRLKRDIVLDWFSGPQQFVQQHQGRINESQIAPLIGEDFD